jgi:hypothetical protein
MKRTTTFTRGSGVYPCRVCQRRTRDDGQRDSVHVRLCSQCYELGGIENMFHDGNAEPSDATEALALLAQLETKGANLTHWQWLRATATSKLAPEKGPAQ